MIMIQMNARNLRWTVLIYIILEKADAEESVINYTAAKIVDESLPYMQRSINNSGLTLKKNIFDDGDQASSAHNDIHFLPNRSVCGLLSDDDRIFGGENAAIDEFPWLVRIKYVLNNGKEVYACAGSLISNNYVLTAAHCAVNLTIKEIRLGDWNIETDPDCQGRTCSDPAVDIKVSQVIAFPEYRKLDTFKGDVALLRLQRPVHFSAFIRPICLPITEEIAKQDYCINDIFWTAGWGKTENEKKATIKQKVSLNAVPLDECRRRQPVITENSAPFVICAGGTGGKDTCVGDSGGSLVKQISGSNSTNWFLVGVTSYGYKHCGSEGRPGLYARVTPLMDWILHTMNV